METSESTLAGGAGRRFFGVLSGVGVWVGSDMAKKEDKAYCLLGIFNVSMPLIYGEGENALVRLRAEIDLGEARKKSLSNL
jgi:hypothetical protein